MSKTFLRSLSASTLLLAGYHILMPYPVSHAARTLQTASLEQSSDAFLKNGSSRTWPILLLTLRRPPI